MPVFFLPFIGDKNLREHLIDSGTGTGKAQDCMDDEADQSVVSS